MTVASEWSHLMATPEEEIVTGYVKLWPREVFYIKPSDSLAELKKSLNTSGVCILYQDFDVFYIGQAVSLFNRLSNHAARRYQL